MSVWNRKLAESHTNTSYDAEQSSPQGEEFEDQEVFKKTTEGVDFRKVHWFNAAVIFTKVLFATGVLSLPAALASLGAVGGAISIVAWGVFNTYSFVILGNFRVRRPHCHSVADMAEVVGGVVAKEGTGFLFIIGYVLTTGSGIIGVSTALNALSHHAACTVWWSLIATVVVVATASIRKFEHVGWLTYLGFISIYAGVLIVVIGVTTVDRPAAAPQQGTYDLGYYAINNPGFAAGMVASSTIFVSSAGTSAFLPVISEMQNPKDYKKALYSCMSLVTASYLAFSLVVYRWCGQWVASPSLGVSIPPFFLIARSYLTAAERRPNRQNGVLWSCPGGTHHKRHPVPACRGEIRLRPYSVWDTPSAIQLFRALGHLVLMHFCPGRYFLCAGRGDSHLHVHYRTGGLGLLHAVGHDPARLAVAVRPRTLPEGWSGEYDNLPVALGDDPAGILLHDRCHLRGC